MCENYRRSGFTLIELLTVISIVLILAAILVPIVGRMKEVSKGVGCTSQLRAIGSSLLSFTADNNGVFMPAYVGELENSDIHSQYPFLGVWYNPYPEGSTGLGEKENSQRIAVCPSNRATNANMTENASGYPYSANFNVMRASGQPVRRVSRFDKLSTTLVMVDSNTDGNWGIGFNSFVFGEGADTIAEKKHGELIHALWMDGHVSALRKNEIKSENLGLDQ